MYCRCDDSCACEHTDWIHFYSSTQCDDGTRGFHPLQKKKYAIFGRNASAHRREQTSASDNITMAMSSEAATTVTTAAAALMTVNVLAASKVSAYTMRNINMCIYLHRLNWLPGMREANVIRRAGWHHKNQPYACVRVSSTMRLTAKVEWMENGTAWEGMREARCGAGRRTRQAHKKNLIEMIESRYNNRSQLLEFNELTMVSDAFAMYYVVWKQPRVVGVRQIHAEHITSAWRGTYIQCGSRFRLLLLWFLLFSTTQFT